MSADWHAGIGAIALIVFTVLSSPTFRRFWTMEDPLRRYLHLSFLFSSVTVIGALLLLV